MGLFGAFFRKRPDFSCLYEKSLSMFFEEGDADALLAQYPEEVLGIFEERLSHPESCKTLWYEIWYRTDALPYFLKYASSDQADRFVAAYWQCVITRCQSKDFVYQEFGNTYSKFWIIHLERLGLKPPLEMVNAFSDLLKRWDSLTYGDSTFVPSEVKPTEVLFEEAKETLRKLKAMCRE